MPKMKHAFFKDKRHYRKIVKVGWIPKKNFTKSEEVPETSEAVKITTLTIMKTRMLRKMQIQQMKLKNMLFRIAE